MDAKISRNKANKVSESKKKIKKITGISTFITLKL